MKFVCERCHTKYSIADEKVRGKVLKVRCKTCANVITVRETGATIDDVAGAGAGPREAPISLSGSIGGDKAKVAKPAALPAAALFSPAAPVAAPPPRKTTPTPAKPPPPPAAAIDGVEWYLAIDGAQTGPFSHSRLCDKILAASKDADVHVWNGNFDAWKAPKDVPELETELGRRRRSLTPAPPPPPRRASGPLPIVAAPTAHSAGTGGHTRGTPSGLATLDPGSQPTKLPGPGPKKNGVPPAGNGAGLGTGQAALGGFGLGDLIGEGDVVSTPPPAGSPRTTMARAAVGPVPAVLPRPFGDGRPSTVAPAVSSGMAVAGPGRQARPVKLVVAALAVVIVLCGIVGVWMFRKPSPTAAVAGPGPTKPAAADFAGLAEKLAKEEAQTPPAAASGKVAESPLPAVVETKTVSGTPVGPVKGGRKPRRKGQLVTAPPPIGAPPTLTAEEREAAARFGESTGRDVRLAASSGSAARGTTTPAQGDISRVINNNRQGIQTCYQRALLRDNTLTHGKVTVRVSIGLSGKVKSVSLDAPAQFRALEPCIREVMSRWAFPPSSEEYGTEFPVVLQGNQ